MTEPDALSRMSRVANQSEQPAPEFSDRLLNELLSELTADQTGPTGSSFDHTSNKTAMEVMTLSPHRNEPPTATRRWLMVAAAVAALALIGGLVAVGTRADDDQVPADQPPQSVPAEPDTDIDPESVDQPEPVEPVEPVDEVESAESLPPVPVAEAVLPTSGSSQGTIECSQGIPREDPERNRTVFAQSCVASLNSDSPSSSEGDSNVSFNTLTVLDNPDLPVDVPAQSMQLVNDSGGLTAGLVLGSGLNSSNEAGSVRTLSVNPGVDDYAGITIHSIGRFENNAETGGGSDWYIDDGTHAIPITEAVDLIGEVTITCEGVPVDNGDPTTATYDQTCTYVSTDPGLVLPPVNQQLVILEAEDGVDVVDSTRHVTMYTDSGTVRSGLVDRDGVIRFIGMTSGTGELAGTLVHETAWGQVDSQGGLTAQIQIFTLPGN